MIHDYKVPKYVLEGLHVAGIHDETNLENRFSTKFSAIQNLTYRAIDEWNQGNTIAGIILNNIAKKWFLEKDCLQENFSEIKNARELFPGWDFAIDDAMIDFFSKKETSLECSVDLLLTPDDTISPQEWDVYMDQLKDNPHFVMLAADIIVQERSRQRLKAILEDQTGRQRFTPKRRGQA